MSFFIDLFIRLAKEIEQLNFTFCLSDYYLGSGTTAVVCKELNRKFIGCDINSKAIKMTKDRLRCINIADNVFGPGEVAEHKS